MGIQPDQFWLMTPWQYTQCWLGVKKRRADDHDQRAWMMYHGAALGKMAAKNFPKTPQDYMSKSAKRKSKPVTGIDEEAIKNQLARYQHRYESENK